MTTLRHANRLLRKATDIAAKAEDHVRGLVVRPPMISREDYEALYGEIDIEAFKFDLVTALTSEKPRDPKYGGLVVRPPHCAETFIAASEVLAELRPDQKQTEAALIMKRI